MAPRLAPPSALSPPPSPKHHTRRKSAQPHTHTHTTKTSKTSRPVLSRRQTTHTHLKPSSKAPSSPTASTTDFSDASDTESFFNFCTACDRQLSADSGNFLYCSESCRLTDLPGNGSAERYAFPASPPLTPFAMTFPPLHERKRSEGRDIVPRCSPSPYSEASRGVAEETTALDSLRELSRALEATGRTPSYTSHTYISPRPTYALPRRESSASSSSQESMDEEDDSEEEEEEYRRLPATPHPGAAIYGTYLKPSSKTFTSGVPLSGRPLPRKGTPETYRARGVDLVTPLL